MAICRMHIACWITKATNAHSEYEILTFSLQHWLRERTSLLHYNYISRLVLNSSLPTGYNLFLCAVVFHSDLGLDGRMILKGFLKEENGTALTGLMWLSKNN